MDVEYAWIRGYIAALRACIDLIGSQQERMILDSDSRKLFEEMQDKLNSLQKGAEFSLLPNSDNIKPEELQ